VREKHGFFAEKVRLKRKANRAKVVLASLGFHGWVQVVMNCLLQIGGEKQ